MGRGTGPRSRRVRPYSAQYGSARFGRLWVGQGIQRGSVPVPKAGPHWVRQQQRRPLYAAMSRQLRGGVDGRPELRRRQCTIPCGGRCGSNRHHRCQPGREPPCGGHVHQKRGEEGRKVGHYRPAPPAAQPPCVAPSGIQAGVGCGAAKRHVAHDHHRGSDRPAVHRRLYRGL